jgi:glycosyltransferase involved in cell wall biosynthesis
LALDQTIDDPGSRTGASLPKLCDRGHVLVFTRSYLQTMGSAVVMKNLLSRFDPESYTLVVSDLRGPSPGESDPRIAVHPIDVTMPDFVPGRWEHLWKQYQPFTGSRVKRLVKSLSPAVIVGVYPDPEFLQFAQRTARALRIPWIAYVHDTILESREHTKYAGWAKALQSKVFSEASSMLGLLNLAQHYADKYGVACKSLPHSYPEPIPTELPEDRDVRREAFWGGSVYGLNSCSAKRVLTALEEVECPLALRTMSTDDTLERQGITGEFVRREVMRDRPEYLEALRRRGLLAASMDWPDETNWHEDEMAIIFPTKAVEYLASGRPILVHCPEHYFLARFFREHKCGLVVTERDPKALVDAVNRLLQGDDEVIEMRKAALAAAQLFSIDRLAPLFSSEVNAVARLSWGEKVPA